MSAAWVAAAVRSRSLAAGRAGAAGAARVAAADSLDEIAELFSRWSYGTRLTDATTAEGFQRATRATQLWQLRVLAGWAPPRGTGILRAEAAEFERDNILARLRELEGGVPEPTHELGTLATSWDLLRHAETPERLLLLLARTPWGGVPEEDAAQLADILEAAWLARCAVVIPASRAWTARRAALIAARLLLVDRDAPGEALVRRLRPVLGTAWEHADDVAALRDALPAPARPLLVDVEGERDLWRAEARAHGLLEAESAASLRRGFPRAETVAASTMLLAVDAWRLQAAVAGAGAARGAREVLDAAS